MDRTRQITGMAGAFALALTVSTAAMAQTIDWSQLAPGTYNWSDNGNWDGGAYAGTVAGQAAQFNDGSFGLPAGDFTILQDVVGLTLGGIEVENSGSPTTVTIGDAGNPITLINSNGNPVTIKNREADDVLIINAALDVTDPEGIRTDGNKSRVVTFNGAVTAPKLRLDNGGAQFGIAAHNVPIVELYKGILFATDTAQVSHINQLNFVNNDTQFNKDAGLQASGGGTVTFNADIDFNTIDAANNNGSELIFIADGGATENDITTLDIAGSITDSGGDIPLQVKPINNGDAVKGIVQFSGSNVNLNRPLQMGFQSPSVVFAPAGGTQHFNGGISEGWTNGETPDNFKRGAGTTVLGGTMTSDRQTIVEAGTLLVNGDYTNAGSKSFGSGYQGLGDTLGHFYVMDGATFGGDGNIAGRTNGGSNVRDATLVNVLDGGTLAPGSSIGALTLDGVEMLDNPGDGQVQILALQSGAELDIDVAGDGSSADQIALWGYADGRLALNDNLVNLSLVGAETPGQYTIDLFTFFSDAGSTPVAHGLVDGLVVGSLGAGINAASISFADANTIQLTYEIGMAMIPGDANGDGQVTGADLSILDANFGAGVSNAISASIAVPEPASMALIGLGGLVLLRRRHV